MTEGTVGSLRALITKWRAEAVVGDTEEEAFKNECADELADVLALLEVEPQQDRFEALKALQADWDSYGAPPLDPATVDRVKLFLHRCSVVPCVAGGVQLEWHTHGLDLEIEFSPDGRTSVFVRAADGTVDITKEGEVEPQADGWQVENRENASKSERDQL